MDERGGPLDGRDAAWDDGEVLAVVLDGARTGGRLAVLLLRLAAGTAQPRHRHQREDETLYVLDGTVHVRVRGRSHPLPAGSGLFVPRGHVHAYAAAASATVLTLFSPAGFGDYFAERAAAGPWSVERLIALAARYGCTITGPAPGLSGTRPGAGRGAHGETGVAPGGTRRPYRRYIGREIEKSEDHHGEHGI